MAFITKEDFTSHIYEEGINKISRNDESKVNGALEIGIQVATRYLSRYNTTEIFATVGDDRAKYGELITYIKDIAKWHFIAVANVTVDLALAENRYTAALTQLKDIRNGETITSWPIAQTTNTSTDSRSGGRLKFNYE